MSFLIDQSGRLMVAEEGIDGRSADVTAPSSHQHGNLLAEASGDLEHAIELLTQMLEGIADHAREGAAAIADAPEAVMLVDLAEGLQARVRSLESL